MKKYLFIAAVLAVFILLGSGFFIAATAVFASVFGWLAWETARRSGPRFFRRPGKVKEHAFAFSSEVGEFSLSPDGQWALFALADHSLSMRSAAGRELFARPMEAKTLAIQALPGGRAYFALPDEVCLCNADGLVEQRLGFRPPPFHQAYRLLYCPQAQVLALHTPWFLQFFPADLSGLGQRISSEDTGHYIKYAALSGDGSRAFMAGAKLLEEEQTAEARWGMWKNGGGAWAPEWKGSEESYMNSHLRGLAFSADGSRVLLEIHRGGYEFRVFESSGAELMRKPGEHPVLSEDGSRVLWESPFEGLVLSDVAGGQKLFSHALGGRTRHKLLRQGLAWILMDGALERLGPQGDLGWRGELGMNPSRMEAPSGSAAWLLAQGRNAALWMLP